VLNDELRALTTHYSKCYVFTLPVVAGQSVATTKGNPVALPRSSSPAPRQIRSPLRGDYFVIYSL